MSNTAKAILAGVIAFAFALPVLVVVHSLTRSASIGESFGYLWNWITAALCGIVTGFASWNKRRKQK